MFRSWGLCIGALMIRAVAGRAGEDCSLGTIAEKADLEESTYCVITDKCEIIGCSMIDSELQAIIAGSDLTKEEYFVGYVAAGEVQAKSSKSLNRVHDIVDSWQPRKEVIIMGFEQIVYDGIVDSGAFAMVLPYNVGKALDYSIGTKGEKLFEAYGVASSIKGYIKSVDLEIDGEWYENISVLWCDKDYDTSEVSIGRADIFPLFTVVIDREKELVEFIPKDLEKRKRVFSSTKGKKRWKQLKLTLDLTEKNKKKEL